MSKQGPVGWRRRHRPEGGGLPCCYLSFVICHFNTVLRFVLGITGASGCVYGIRLLELLLSQNCELHVVVSPTAELVLLDELAGLEKQEDPKRFLLDAVEKAGQIFSFRQYDKNNGNLRPFQGNLHVHRFDDYFAPISSGSFATDGMVVCPCTGSSLAHIASGVNRHLIHRAAEVHLKERRPLIAVVRETPLSRIHLKNMLTVSESGGTILPASPHFYGFNPTAAELIDSVVAKILDRLRIDHPLENRWK